jgi:hypothetical protein
MGSKSKFNSNISQSHKVMSKQMIDFKVIFISLVLLDAIHVDNYSYAIGHMMPRSTPNEKIPGRKCNVVM